MALQRILKKSICTSEDINALSFFEEALFYRLIVNADDKGEQDGRPEIIRATCFPLKQDMTLSAIRKALTNMLTVGLVSITEEGGRPILRLTKWECHQRIRTTSAPLTEKKKGTSDDLAATCGEPRRTAAGKEKENKKEKSPHSPLKEKIKEKEKRDSLPSECVPVRVCESFSPPTLEAVKAYVSDHHLNVDASLWYAFYSSNGWYVGNAPMRDWRGSLRSWHLRGEKNASRAKASTDGITEHSFDGDEFLKSAIQHSMR